jgi:DNA-binding LytR/AlgR family response regulator
MKEVKAIIADDEAALRDTLKRKLEVLYPEMVICGEACDGFAALELTRNLLPDIAFLDINMPGLSGIEVAKILPEKCLPVFITAHDEFALRAFEAGAIDYLLKPVTDGRLEKTVKRLRSRMHAPSFSTHNVQEILQKLNVAVRKTQEYLQWIKVQHKDSIRLISVKEVLYFHASDKYTVVRTTDKEFLIKKTITELVAELSPDLFWQIHRSTIVNVTSIDTISRSLTGGYQVRLKNMSETLPVSRSFSHLFKQM